MMRKKHIFLRRFWGLLLVLLAGCTTAEMIPNASVLSKGWYKPPEPSHKPKAYCYKSLGHNNCYSRPLPKSEMRRVRSHESDELESAAYEPTILTTWDSRLDRAQMHSAVTPRQGKTASTSESSHSEEQEAAVPPKRLSYSSDTSP